MQFPRITTTEATIIGGKSTIRNATRSSNTSSLRTFANQINHPCRRSSLAGPGHAAAVDPAPKPGATSSLFTNGLSWGHKAKQSGARWPGFSAQVHGTLNKCVWSSTSGCAVAYVTENWFGGLTRIVVTNASAPRLESVVQYHHTMKR